MIRVKMLARNEVAVIEDGKVLLFNNGGRCINEDAGFVGKYMEGSLDLPIISILSSNGVLDIAVFEPNKSMIRYESPLSSMDCAMQLQMQGNFVRMLRHDGESNGIKYNQLIFIYREGCNLSSFINAIQGKEIIN